MGELAFASASLFVGTLSGLPGFVLLVAAIRKIVKQRRRAVSIASSRQSLRPDLAAGLGCTLLAVGIALLVVGSLILARRGDGQAVSLVLPTSQPPATATEVRAATPTATRTPLNRMSCDQIRGTDYISPEERDWYRSNCEGRLQGAGPGPTVGTAATATTAPAGPPQPTPMVNPSVTITSPLGGEAVPLYLHVSGRSTGFAPGQAPSSPPPWLYLVLRPSPELAGQSWFVQPIPIVVAMGRGMRSSMQG
jgi:hypothetical protein